MKRLLVLVLLSVIVFSASSEGRTEPGTVNLKMSWWGGDSRHQGTIAAIELWNKTHPNVKVEYSYSGWDGYHDKLAVQLAGGTAPDVFQYSYSNTAAYGDMDVLEDLTPYAKTKFGDFAEGMWRFGIYNGKKLGAPTGASTYALMYNKTMLQKLGVRLLTQDETWESYLELCKAATRDTNGDGKIDFWGAGHLYEIPVDGLIPIYNQFGIQFWSKDGKHSMFDNATAQGIWKMFKTFVDAKVCLGPLDATVPEGLSPISAGLVATEFGPASGFSSEVAAAEGKYELDMVRLPQHIKGKSGQVIDTPMLFGIYKKGKNKPQAIDFLAWFLTDVEAAKTAGMIRGMYGTAKLREALKGTFKGYDLAMVKLLDLVEAENNPLPMNDPPQRDQWEDILSTERDKLVHGQVTLEQFFNNAIKYADPSLSE
jgi:multiple sugar transport system substrate-binding protein